jgi:hypothetical protein
MGCGVPVPHRDEVVRLDVSYRIRLIDSRYVPDSQWESKQLSLRASIELEKTEEAKTSKR